MDSKSAANALLLYIIPFKIFEDFQMRYCVSLYVAQGATRWDEKAKNTNKVGKRGLTPIWPLVVLQPLEPQGRSVLLESSK